MTDQTVNVEGQEFSAETLERLLDQVEDEDGRVQGGIAVKDGVFIAGDSDNDTFVRVGRIEEADEISPCGNGSFSIDSGYVYTSKLRNTIERQSRESFREYVADIDGFGSANRLESRVDAPITLTSTHDIAASYGFIGEDEMRALIEDDGVEIGKVGTHEDRVYVGLKDTRDE